jgi:dTDP-4-amino-4,6-dideoxygalactose transaminase
MIPIAKPLIGPEEEAAVLAVLRSGMIVQGPQVAQFEESFAALCGVRYAVAVSSGTAALHMALLAHGIGPGDEVITTPFSFFATASSILMTGARPVFVDIDEHSFNLNPDLIAAAITPRTKAILPVHLYGHPAEMDAICTLAKEHDLAVIEDAAQAVGASYRGRPAGSFGTACFSLYATKNIMTGEGGMVTTDDPAVADQLKLLRAHGSRVRYYHEMVGYNYRMTDMQAAIGNVQLGKLASFTQARQANAAYLSHAIENEAVITPGASSHVEHVYHQYTLRVRGDRDAAVQQLTAAGVGTAVFYPLPLHQQQAVQELCPPVSLPVSELVSRQVLSLPVHPALTQNDLEQIAAAVNGLQIG